MKHWLGQKLPIPKHLQDKQSNISKPKYKMAHCRVDMNRIILIKLSAIYPSNIVALQLVDGLRCQNLKS